MPSWISSTASRVARDPFDLTHPDNDDDDDDHDDENQILLIDWLTLDRKYVSLHDVAKLSTWVYGNMSSYLVSPIVGQLSYFSHSALVVKGPTWFSDVMNNARWETSTSLPNLSRTIITWQSSPGMSPSRKWSQFGKLWKKWRWQLEGNYYWVIQDCLHQENTPDE